MLNQSTEHEISTAHKTMLKIRLFLISNFQMWHFNIHEHDTCSVELSWTFNMGCWCLEKSVPSHFGWAAEQLDLERLFHPELHYMNICTCIIWTHIPHPHTQITSSADVCAYFVRGGPTLTTFFLVDVGWEDPNTTIIGPLSARQRNDI